MGCAVGLAVLGLRVGGIRTIGILVGGTVIGAVGLGFGAQLGVGCSEGIAVGTTVGRVERRLGFLDLDGLRVGGMRDGSAVETGFNPLPPGARVGVLEGGIVGEGVGFGVGMGEGCLVGG